MSSEKPVLVEVRNLKKYFPVGTGFGFGSRGAAVKAVDGVSFDVHKGETLGLLGESGCGKTTAGRAILQLYRPTSGEVIFAGKDLAKLGKKELRTLRCRIQMVFQDPYSSLNPRASVHEIVSEPMRIHKLCPSTEISERVSDLLNKVGLNPRYAIAFPTNFRAVSASASRSRAPWRSIPILSSATNRSRPWMCRYRPRSSTCSRTSRMNST